MKRLLAFFARRRRERHDERDAQAVVLGYQVGGSELALWARHKIDHEKG